MDKKQYIDLLRTIREAYNNDPMGFDDPAMAAAYAQGTYPFQARSAPAGWMSPKEKAEKEIKDFREKELSSKREQAEHHVRENTFNLSPEAHAKAMSILKKHGADQPDTLIQGHTSPNLKEFHAHLVSSGVDSNHPAMRSLKQRIADAEQHEKDMEAQDEYNARD